MLRRQIGPSTAIDRCGARAGASARPPPAGLAEDGRNTAARLTYMIPADAPPSFDGHREATYATIHSAAPFYSVLIRVNPENPSSTTDFVCDLCTAMPQPTDGGKTYTFKIRDGVKFHDGSPLTADDVAASWNKIIDPPEGVISARAEQFHDGRQDRGARPDDRRLPAEIRDRRLSAGARRPLRLDLQEGDPRQGPALVREEHPGLRARSSFAELRDRPVDKGRAQPRLLSPGTALSRRLHRDLCRQAGGAGRCDPRRPRGDRVPRPAARGPRRAGQGARRQDRGAGERLELRRAA